jgi:hypothetical protein
MKASSDCHADTKTTYRKAMMASVTNQDAGMSRGCSSPDASVTVTSGGLALSALPPSIALRFP